MRLVHTADWHLGFMQFDRGVNGGGGVYQANQREYDVFLTFRALIDQIIEVQPDVVVIAGDLIHSVRPNNRTVQELMTGCHRLVRSLPNVPIVVACGNHEIPKARETGVLLDVLKLLGIHVADWETTQFTFPHLGLSVLAVPEGVSHRALAPDPAFRRNVMVLHGEVHGMGGVDVTDRSKVEIPLDAIQPPAWDYVALGHYHVHQQLAPNMAYSGSIDYTSSNYWGELKAEQAEHLPGKGFIERDLETGVQVFHPLPRSRDFLDLSLSAEGMTPEELTIALREKLEDEHVDGTVARVVVTDCERHVFREVDPKLLREYKGRALNLFFDIRRPEVIRIGSTTSSGRRQWTLDQIVADFLVKRFPPGSDTSLEGVSKLFTGYLAEASEGGADPTPALEASLEARAS